MSASTDVAAKSAAAEPVASPVTAVSPVRVDESRDSSQGVNSEVMCQVKSLFGSFAQSLKVRFSNINRFSQVLSGTSSVASQDINVCQDVLTPSLPALTVVAGCAEPAPDRGPSASCSVCLGTTLGGPIATVSPTGTSSPSRLSFANLLVMLRVVESSGGVCARHISGVVAWKSCLFRRSFFRL